MTFMYDSLLNDQLPVQNVVFNLNSKKIILTVQLPQNQLNVKLNIFVLFVLLEKCLPLKRATREPVSVDYFRSTDYTPFYMFMQN